MKDEVSDKALQTVFERASSEHVGKPKAIEVDLMAYVHYLDGLDGTADQKLEILRSIAAILLGFIDLGYDVVFTEECCGKLLQNEAEPAQLGRSDLDSDEYERGRP